MWTPPPKQCTVGSLEVGSTGRVGWEGRRRGGSSRGRRRSRGSEEKEKGEGREEEEDEEE